MLQHNVGVEKVLECNMSEYTENIKNISFMKGALIVDNHDESIIGYTEIKNVGYVYIYSMMSIIDELIDNDGMIEEDREQPLDEIPDIEKFQDDYFRPDDI